jgi:rare lipoprotein A
MHLQINRNSICLVSMLFFFTALHAQLTDSLNLYHKEGYASYYANKFNGRITTSGERFSNKQLTAAHRTLAFGTLVKVTNTKTGKCVILKINDRGPHSRKRIIDVTRRAAKHLGMLNGKGIVWVRVEELPSQNLPKSK